MKSTIAEITQTGRSIIKNYSRQTIIDLKSFENIYSIVESECSNSFSIEDMKHITNYIMGLCGIA